MSANSIPTNNVSTNNGVLTEWVCQSQSQVKESGGAITYQEVFKGPFATGKELLSKIETGDKIDSVHLLMGGRNQLFTAPSCPKRGDNNGVWRLQTIQITEETAGSHCLLQLLFLADYSGIDSEEKLTEDIYQNTWSVSWQSYTVSPYAFCSNPEEPINLKVTENEDKDKGKLKASRETIQKYLSQNGTNNVFKNSIKDKETYRLNVSEVLILQKINANKNAVYHYPIVTHTTLKSGPFNDTSSNLSSETPKQPTKYDDALGGDLDTIVSELPKECPYTFAILESVGNKEWQWIKIADDIDEQHTKKTTQFTRREQWMGVVDADVSFYSNVPFNRTELSACRWIVGEL